MLCFYAIHVFFYDRQLRRVIDSMTHASRTTHKPRVSCNIQATRINILESYHAQRLICAFICVPRVYVQPPSFSAAMIAVMWFFVI